MRTLKILVVLFVLLYTVLAEECEDNSNENDTTLVSGDPVKCNSFKQFLKTIGGYIKQSFKFIANLVQKLWEKRGKITEFLLTHWREIFDIKGGILNLIKKAPEAIISFLKDFKDKYFTMEGLLQVISEKADKRFNETYEKFQKVVLNTSISLQSIKNDINALTLFVAIEPKCDVKALDERANSIVEEASSKSSECGINMKDAIYKAYDNVKDLFKAFVKNGKSAYEKIKACWNDKDECNFKFFAIAEGITEIIADGTKSVASFSHVSDEVTTAFACLEKIKGEAYDQKLKIQEELKDC